MLSAWGELDAYKATASNLDRIAGWKNQRTGFDFQETKSYVY